MWEIRVTYIFLLKNFATPSRAVALRLFDFPSKITSNQNKTAVQAVLFCLWRWGKSNPRAEGCCKEVYIRSALFGLN